MFVCFFDGWIIFLGGPVNLLEAEGPMLHIKIYEGQIGRNEEW